MEVLLNERTKRKHGQFENESVAVGRTSKASEEGEKTVESLQSLVDSVKRKSKHSEKGAGKRRKL